MLRGKRVVLGVTGSIACYKGADIASKLTQAGAEVDVILTDAAQKFVSPLTFRSLTARPVFTDMYDPQSPLAEEHVALARSCDALLIAPASATTLARLAHGLADNMVALTALATTAPVVVAPAMDAQMWEHAATRANCDTLRDRGVVFVGPAEGRLASGHMGLGRLAETEQILGALAPRAVFICAPVNDDNFEKLGELPNLEKLAFGGNKMSGSALPLLKLVPQLRELSVGGQQRTDSGLWSVNVTDFNVGNIADLSALKVLDLSGTAISDRGVTELARLRNLEALDLSRTKVTAKGLAALGRIETLRHLKLAQSAGVDDTVLVTCQNFERLEVLELQETRITFEGLMSFSPKPCLKRLFIGGAALTSEQVRAVQKRLPYCYLSWWPATAVAATAER